MEILGITNNGLNGIFDDCYDLIPCVDETNIIDPNGLVYGVSICQEGNKWVAATVHYKKAGLPTE